MFSKNFRKNKHFSETGFRYRGIESSRIEHLTDAVFAFAITLLVIASEVPRNYVELQASMYNFVGFIACSLLLLGLWSNHSNFFLNYGMQDRKTKILNFIFLFVLLFYIYPLKYLFSHLSNLVWVNVIGEKGLKNEAFVIAYNKAVEAQLTVANWQDLMLRFGLGLLLIYVILGIMHINALRKKEELELNEQEVYETKSHIYNFLFLCLVCITSMIVVLITGGNGSGISGLVYLLIPIVLPILKKLLYKNVRLKFPNSFGRNSDKFESEKESMKDNSYELLIHVSAELEKERQLKAQLHKEYEELKKKEELALNQKNAQKQEDSIQANVQNEEQETPDLGVTSKPKENTDE